MNGREILNEKCIYSLTSNFNIPRHLTFRVWYSSQIYIKSEFLQQIRDDCVLNNYSFEKIKIADFVEVDPLKLESNTQLIIKILPI